MIGGRVSSPCMCDSERNKIRKRVTCEIRKVVQRRKGLRSVEEEVDPEFPVGVGASQ